MEKFSAGTIYQQKKYKVEKNISAFGKNVNKT